MTVSEFISVFNERLYFMAKSVPGISGAEIGVKNSGDSLPLIDEAKMSTLLNGEKSVSCETKGEMAYLPYQYGKCYKVKLPMHQEGNIVKLVVTPLLQGCSIHIIKKEDHWVILHDARTGYTREINGKVSEYRRCDSGYLREKASVSFEWTNRGYCFTDDHFVALASKRQMDENGEYNIFATVIFVYDEERAGWHMKGRCAWEHNVSHKISHERGFEVPLENMFQWTSYIDVSYFFLFLLLY